MREELEQKIHEFAEQMYKAGYKDRCLLTDEECLTDQKRQYERGLNDAWECARWLIKNRSENDCQKLNEFMSVEYTMNIFNMFASDAIAKIKEYEEKQKQPEEWDSETMCGQFYEDDEGIKAQVQTDNEIKVGDEVDVSPFCNIKSYKALVIHIDNDSETIACMRTDGSSVTYVHPNKVSWTGRHFPQIAEVLKQMKDGQ